MHRIAHDTAERLFEFQETQSESLNAAAGSEAEARQKHEQLRRGMGDIGEPN